MSLKSSCASRAPGKALHGGIAGLVLQSTVLHPFWQCHFSNGMWGAAGDAQLCTACWAAQVVSGQGSAPVGAGGGSRQVPQQPLLLQGCWVVPDTAKILN